MNERNADSKEEQTLLATVFERAAVGHCLVGPDNRVRMANAAWLRSTGLTREQAIGHDIFDLLPETRDLARAVHARARAGEMVVVPRHVQHVNGRRTWWEGTVTPVPVEGGIGLLITAREVTEQVRAEEERERLLREIDTQRHLFQAVVENAPVAIAVLRGPDFVYEMVNPAFQAFAPAKHMVGRTFAEVWPELVPEVLPVLERVMRGGEPHHAVDVPYHARRTPEGPLEEVYLTRTYVPLRDRDGRVAAVLVLLVDTTEQVRTRQRIEELADVAQRRATELATIVESIADAVFVCDAQGNITLVNKAGLALIGGEREKLLRTVRDYLDALQLRYPDGRTIPIEETVIVRALRGEASREVERIATHPVTSLRLDLLVSSAPLRDEKGTVGGAVWVVSDITRIKELDRLKDQFVTVALHEFRTPLTILKGYAQHLQRGPDACAPRYRSVLAAIDRQTMRIAHLVQDLLDVSRAQAGRVELLREPVDLSAFAAEMVERIAAATTKHRLTLHQPGPVVVHGDRDRLEQVLVNLLDNAMRYSPGGGDVAVDVRREDGQARLCVTDHGVGIPEEKQKHIFERFYRAHTDTPYDYGGMGVGLYISREIVRGHGGEMSFTSKEGKGSTFCFTLPLA